MFRSANQSKKVCRKVGDEQRPRYDIQRLFSKDDISQYSDDEHDHGVIKDAATGSQA